MTSPAGLSYVPGADALEVKLFVGDHPPCPLVSRPATTGELRLHLQRGEADGRLYALVVESASTSIPTGVLRGPTRRPLPPPGPMSSTPGDWFVPLFPEAPVVARSMVAVDDGTGQPPVGLSLSSSGRIVGFVIPSGLEQLSPSITGRPA